MAQPDKMKMPKWLLYGLIAKGVIIVLIVLTVLWYAGVFGSTGHV